jgi:hypothetical protein
MGHALMENRSELIVAGRDQATDIAERKAAEETIVRSSPGVRRLTPGGASSGRRSLTSKAGLEFAIFSGPLSSARPELKSFERRGLSLALGALPSEGKGRVFESRRARQQNQSFNKTGRLAPVER